MFSEKLAPKRTLYFFRAAIEKGLDIQYLFQLDSISSCSKCIIVLIIVCPKPDNMTSIERKGNNSIFISLVVGFACTIPDMHVSKSTCCSLLELLC